MIIKGFRQCDHIESDGETSNLHSRLQETIKKRKVPEKVIQGVNKFLEEMMALQLDEESPDEEVELSENCTAMMENLMKLESRKRRCKRKRRWRV